MREVANMTPQSERSYESLTQTDLDTLRDLALYELSAFFGRRSDLTNFRSKLVAIALCQGAALHYVDGITGIKDFDIYFFFSVYDNRLVNRRPATKEGPKYPP